MQVEVLVPYTVSTRRLLPIMPLRGLRNLKVTLIRCNYLPKLAGGIFRIIMAIGSTSQALGWRPA